MGIVIEDDVGLSADELDQFQTGVEQISRDYGGFELVGADRLLAALDSSEQRSLNRCGTDAGCMAGLLYVEAIDFVLHFRVDPDPQGLLVTVSGLNIRDGRVEAVQEGFLPGVADTMFLLVPIHETLAVLSAIEVEPAQVTSGQQEEGLVPPRQTTPEYGEPSITEAGPPEPGSNILAMSLEIGGAAVMAGGILFWVLADDTQQEIQSEPHERDELSDLQSKGDTYETIGNIAVATGAILMVTGLTFDLIGIGAPDSNGSVQPGQDEWARVRFHPLPAGASISLELGF